MAKRPLMTDADVNTDPRLRHRSLRGGGDTDECGGGLSDGRAATVADAVPAGRNSMNQPKGREMRPGPG